MAKRPRARGVAPAPPGARLRTVGVIRSSLRTLGSAPRQGSEGAPDAWLEVRRHVAEGLRGLAVGDEIVVITWLHRARRDVLRVHPRSDPRIPLTGVFATRSPDRPNPLGLHHVLVRAIDGDRLRVGPIEAIDGTPVVDIKPVMREAALTEGAGRAGIARPGSAPAGRPGRPSNAGTAKGVGGR
jgi:tRNA-Thr(GGU) m(6)t(6)A37 methyltransferase TsaA